MDEPILDQNPRNDLLAALLVMVLDPRISEWLSKNDPQALKQARAAIANAGGDTPANKLPEDLDVSLKEYELTWCQCPTNFHETRIARVKAQSPEDARTLLHDAIKGTGTEWFTIQTCKEYVKPAIPGEVLSF